MVGMLCESNDTNPPKSILTEIVMQEKEKHQGE